MAEPTKVKFVFQYDPEFSLYPANGAWGGLTPKGDLRLDFFVESFPNPESITQTIGPGGALTDELKREPSPLEGTDTVIVNRRFEVGVLLSGNQIATLAAFLTQKANELKGLMKGQDDDASAGTAAVS